MKFQLIRELGAE